MRPAIDQVAANGTLIGAVTLAGGSSINAEPGTTLTMTGAIGQVGGSQSLTKSGTGALILQPQGVFPQVTGPTLNTCIASVPTGGLWANGPITLAEDPTPNNVFSIGDAAHRAARFQPDGLSIRGYDNALHSITASPSE